MAKKNVAFVISSLNAGGAERVITTLANVLVKDFNITIILLYNCTPFYRLEKDIQIEYCSELYISKPTTWQSITNHYTLFRNLIKILKKRNIDISIGFMTTANIYLSFASKIYGIPCIISERIHPEYFKLNKLWKTIRRWTYPLATKLVVQTKSIKTYFEHFMDNDQIVIIKNPLAPELLHKRKLNSKKEKIILNVGRLDHQKNQDLLIRAFANINNDDWSVNIIGEGSNRVMYEQLIKVLNLEEKVNLLGNQPDMETYYNQSSIFVFTSRYEGFPNALMEAMSFGLPCISTDCPSGPSELISNDLNGFLIPVENQNLLEKKMRQLMDDSLLRTKFSEKSVTTTLELEVSVIAEQWKSLIYKVLK